MGGLSGEGKYSYFYLFYRLLQIKPTYIQIRAKSILPIDKK